jgi:stage II sporulation protein D
MNRSSILQPLLGLLAATVLALTTVQPVPQLAEQSSLAPGETSFAHRATLRVGMWTLWHDREVVLAGANPGDRVTLRRCPECATLSFARPVHVKAVGDSVALVTEGDAKNAKQLWLTGAVTLTAHGESATLQYPLTISARSGVLVIAVTLPVERYVERVVASESSSADNAESLKALSIVVRTFALHQAHGHADYDLCDSTHCQLLHWSGNSDRRAAAHAAVLATAGETLWFHDQRALAYFGKDCGGHTASPDEIWPQAKPAPYLPSQTDRFCAADGGHEWASEIARADLTALLAAHGIAAPGWQDLTVARRGASGRAVTLRLDRHEVSADVFRLAVGESLGWNRIPSTWFEVSREGDRFVFHGRGWGHGVGLCQKGAASMAGQGRSAREILNQYFPGAHVADETTGRQWKSFAGSGFVLESLDAADAAYLPELDRTRAEASERSGLNATLAVTVRAFASTPAFRDATLAPGWVAAFTEGDWIGVQPLRTLAARHLLAGVMRHEFLHALVEHEAGSSAPLWLREGLVEVWSEADGQAAASIARKPAPALMLGAVDAALERASTEAEAEAAHRAAEWYAAQLLGRYGRVRVLEWLRSGLPAGIVAGLGRR